MARYAPTALVAAILLLLLAASPEDARAQAAPDSTGRVVLVGVTLVLPA